MAHTISPGSIAHMSACLGIKQPKRTKIGWAAQAWLGWNYLCSEQATAWLRSEDVPRIAGQDNARQHEDLTAEQVRAECESVHELLWPAIVEFAGRYGYEL